MTIEQALIALLVVLVLLINVVAPVLRRLVHAAERERVETGPPSAAVRRRIIPIEQAHQAPDRSRFAPVLSAPAVPSRRSQPVTLRAARRGIVLMAVLGACRGLEPPDRPHGMQ
jgi:hypothetical protein